MKRIDYFMQPKEYHHIMERYGVRWIYFEAVLTVARLSNGLEPIRTKRISEELSMTRAGAGYLMNLLEERRLVINISGHERFRDWRLTPKGNTLARFLAECDPL